MALLVQTGFRSLQKQRSSTAAQPWDNNGPKMLLPRKHGVKHPKAPKAPKVKKPKVPKAKKVKAPAVPKEKASKGKRGKSSASPSRLPSASPTTAPCTVIPPSCERNTRRNGRNLQQPQFSTFLEKILHVFPNATGATPESNTLNECAYGTSACSSSIGTCCGASGCQCNAP